MKSVILLAVSFFLLGVLKDMSWAQYDYIEVLPPGWISAEAHDINDNNTVVGSGRDSDNRFKGFAYKNGLYKTLLPNGWKESYAHGVNNKGAIVGHGLHTVFKGFLYSGGFFTEIYPAGWHEAYAYSINDKGDVVGYGREKRFYKGFLFKGGAYIDIIPPDWREAFAYDINNRGMVTGYGVAGDDHYKGFIYINGEYTEIVPPGWQNAKAVAINDKGDIVGYGMDSNNENKSFIYKKGTYEELLTTGWQTFEAYGVNSRGAVTGKISYGSVGMKGFFYNGTSYTTLLPSGWIWSQANAVNDKGDVVGFGSRGFDKTGFLARGTPDIAVDPTIIFFGGNINSGVMEDKSATIINKGAGNLVMGTITEPSLPFSIVSDNCSGQTLAPLTTCIIIYRALPLSAITVVSNSNIPSNDPDKGVVKLILGIFPDNDSDGYTLDIDCDDNDPSVNPGTTEILNNKKDDDCDHATKDNAKDVR